MKKTINLLGIIILLLIMVVTVFTYLAPHLGWQDNYPAIFTGLLNTAYGFFFGLVVPTVIFTALYVRTILRFLQEGKRRDLGEIANK